MPLMLTCRMDMPVVLCVLIGLDGVVPQHTMSGLDSTRRLPSKVVVVATNIDVSKQFVH